MEMDESKENEDLGESEYEYPAPRNNYGGVKPRLPIWATPPWPEWDDSTINVEVWEENESIERFIDPTGMLLPKSIKPVKWVRPEFLLELPKLVDWGAGKIDLINANIHICELSDEIRFMLSEISELFDHGVINAFQVEGEGTAFVPNSDHTTSSWAPWDHIYSDCKAGLKGDRPTLNRIGKYYVRLYFLGVWRRITVDDQIPLLADDRIALPISSNGDLWPLILIKALLKLASLSSDSGGDGDGVPNLQSFNTTTALTGWVHEWVDVEGPVSNTKLWTELNDILPKYHSMGVVSNYWTTGKTKRERLAEQAAAQKWKTEADSQQATELLDVYTNWWTQISLAEREPGVEYLEFSDSEDAPNDLDRSRPRSAPTTSVFSGTEGEDEAEGTDLEEEQQEPKLAPVVPAPEKNTKGKKDKSKKGKRKGKTGDTSESTIINEVQEDGVDSKKSNLKNSSKKDKSSKKGKKDKSKLKKTPSKKLDGETTGDEGESGTEFKKGRKSKKPTESTATETSIEEPSESGKLPIVETGEDDQKPMKHIKKRVPMMKDILEGIRQFMGTENFPLVAAWESLSGKHIPDVISVVLTLFPRAENAGPIIPSFLFHPINLVEVRDGPLIREPGRPTTPLWKTFRWKSWAMKKGLIPMETDPTNIRCIKAKTPFALKTDWYQVGMGVTHVEPLGKGDEDEEEYLVALAPPGTPVVPEICGGGNPPSANETDEDNGSTETPNKASNRSIKSKKSKKKLGSRKMSVGKKGSTGSKGSFSAEGKTSQVKKKGSKSKRKESDNLSPEEEEGPWEQESENEMESAPLPTPVSDIGPEEFVSMSACGSVWFHVDNISQYIRKLSKYYSTQNTFGSCFILRRKPDWTDEASSKPFQDGPADPEITVSQKLITDFHSIQDSFNLTIQFESSKILSINNDHLDKSGGRESAFYLFSDSWMVQEILVSLDVLQANDVNGYADKSDAVAWNAPDENVVSSPTNIGVVLEPWDWRKDSSSSSIDFQSKTAMLRCVTDTRWSGHVTLRPGRNLFRIWVAENPEEGEGICNTNPYTMSPYVIKLSAKTPIHVGSRDEILKFMTNEPVLLLKQSDVLAQNFWALFLLFGKPKNVYAPSLRALHKAYCPSYRGKEPNCLYKKLKRVHLSFENKFLALIVKLNDGVLDRMLLLAMRCLFLNPILGQELWESMHPRPQPVPDEPVAEVEISEAKQLANLVIQRYCRGWLVRRLFQLRIEGNKKFTKIEFQIRKMAYLLALNTDCVFTQGQSQTEPIPSSDDPLEPTVVPSQIIEPSRKSIDPTVKSSEKNIKLSDPKHYNDRFEQFDSEFEGETGPEGIRPAEPDIPGPSLSSTTSPTLVPTPPKWAVNLLKDILKEFPLLFALYPHAYCVPHHLTIRDTEGWMPSGAINCTPFYRRVICIVGEGNWCTCMIQIQVTPPTDVVMRVIDNDTQTCLEAESVHFFLGQLQCNKLGYTVLCYRLNPTQSRKSQAAKEVENSFLHQWKLRIVTPSIQDHLAYKDEIYVHQQHAHHHHHHQPHELFQFVAEESVDPVVDPAAGVENNRMNLDEEAEEEEEEEAVNSDQQDMQDIVKDMMDDQNQQDQSTSGQLTKQNQQGPGSSSSGPQRLDSSSQLGTSPSGLQVSGSSSRQGMNSSSQQGPGSSLADQNQQDPSQQGQENDKKKRIFSDEQADRVNVF